MDEFFEYKMSRARCSAVYETDKWPKLTRETQIRWKQRIVVIFERRIAVQSNYQDPSEVDQEGQYPKMFVSFTRGTLLFGAQ